MSHQIKRMVIDTKGVDKHAGRCKCGAFSGHLDSRQEVEDWEYRHREEIERVKANLGSRTPSLKSQRDYYQARADDTTETPEYRQQWQRLADEISHRLNDHVTGQMEQLPLVFE